jgi:ribosome biogenesis GTPase
VKVGDWVELSDDSGELRAIEKIFPRTSRLERGRGYKKHVIASNIDQLLILMSTRQPDFRTTILDRYLIIAERNRIPAIICLNKIDLADPTEYKIYEAYYTNIGYPFHMISAKNKTDLGEIESLLTGKVTALFGHSGVGKSSLVKAIQPEVNIKIGDVSRKTRKGQHTTTHVEMYYLKNVNGFVIDTPGIKELGIGDILKKELKNFFIEFREYEEECQFNDCDHVNEPGCAIRQAVEEGKILASRYENYISIYGDLPSHEYEWEQGKVRPI